MSLPLEPPPFVVADAIGHFPDWWPSFAPERWAPVPGWPGLDASTLGRIRSTRGRRGPRVLRTRAQRGYPALNVWHQGRHRTVTAHRLVALAWLGTPPPGCEVRHLDGDRRNPALWNLALGTRAENHADAIRHGWRPGRIGARRDPASGRFLPTEVATRL